MRSSWLRQAFILAGLPAAALAGMVAAGHMQTAAQPLSPSGPAQATQAQVQALNSGTLLAGTMVLAQAGTTSANVRGVSSATCMNCHGSTPKYPVLGAKLTYEHSAHKLNGNATYANGGGCQQCHTNEGFIEWTQKGKIDPATFVANPSQPGCMTCHAPHETGTMALRTTKAVTLVNKEEFDGGKGNLCASCHQSRSDAKAAVKDLPAKDVTARLGAHHGPQADMMVGTNAYQFPGKTYGSSDHYSSVDNTCVSCHMNLPKGRYSLSPEIGGHSMNLAGEVHEVETLNTSACVSCHKDMKQAPGTASWSKFSDAGVQWVGPTAVFAVTASDDYDRDGKKEYVQDEVQGLMDLLVNPQGTGAMQTKLAMYDAKGTYIGAKAAAPYTAAQVGALFNYRYVLEDRSRGIHNLTYTVQLLTDSIAALDPAFDTSARPK